MFLNVQFLHTLQQRHQPQPQLLQTDMQLQASLKEKMALLLVALRHDVILALLCQQHASGGLE